MGARWFNIAVTLVWLSTTTWLVVAKIVPPLRRGEPPNYRNMYSEQAGDKPLYVGWDMSLNGDSLGYAVISLTKKMSGDITEVESRIHFDHVPLEELSPAWMKALVAVCHLADRQSADVCQQPADDRQARLPVGVQFNSPRGRAAGCNQHSRNDQRHGLENQGEIGRRGIPVRHLFA